MKVYLLLFALMVEVVKGAVSSTTPISAMPITTNVADTAYFPLIQPYPGRLTNDNFRATTADIFKGRGTIITTNVYATNIYATNIYVTQNITVEGTNVGTINPTIGRVPYKDGTNSFGDSAIYYIDPSTVGAQEVDVNLVIISNLVNNALLITKTVGGVDGVVTNIPSALGVLTNDGAGAIGWFPLAGGTNDPLWQSVGNTYSPRAQEDNLFATNIFAIGGLFSDAFVLTTEGNALALGENDITAYATSYMIFTATTTNAADTQLRLSSGHGSGYFLILQNGSDNAFTLLNGDELWDDSSLHLYLSGGDWKPTVKGQTLFLIGSSVGYAEVGRFGGPTNVLTSDLWSFSGGYLQPTDLTQPLFWTNSVTWGPGTTNLLFRVDNTLMYGAFDTPGTTYPYFAVTNLTEASMAMFGSGGNLALVRGNAGVSLSDSLTAGNETRWTGHFFAPPADTHGQLGGDTSTSLLPWYQANVYTNTIYGFKDSINTNYSRGQVSHTGTNGVWLFDSQANGTAGAARSIEFALGGTNHTELKVVGGASQNIITSPDGAVTTTLYTDNTGVSGMGSSADINLWGNGFNIVANGQAFETTSGIDLGVINFPWKTLFLSQWLTLQTPHTPANSSEAGEVGQITWDANYIYVWTATNVNKRATLATW